jgi:hypothetical protein
MIRSRFAEGAVVFLAALLASGVVAFAILVPFQERGTAPQLQMERDGTPRLVDMSAGYPGAIKIMDLDGNLVDELSYREWQKRQMAYYMIARRDEPWLDAYRRPTRYGFWGWGWARSKHGALFLMRDDGYLVVYDRRTRRPALYVSPSGVSPAQPADDDRFREPTGFGLAEDLLVLNADGKLFVADLDARRLKTVYSSTSGPVHACALVVQFPHMQMTGGDVDICVLDGDKVTLLDPEGNTKLTVRIPEEMPTTGMINFGTGDEGIFAVWTPQWWAEDKTARAAVFDSDGKLLAKHEWAPPEAASEVLPMVVVSVIWLALAGLCLWHARRHALALWKIIAWTVFVLVTGPMGAAVYFGVLDFAPLVKCGSCGGRRPADREKCPRCGAIPEPPARTGIEIIEPA